MSCCHTRSNEYTVSAQGAWHFLAHMQLAPGFAKCRTLGPKSNVIKVTTRASPSQKTLENLKGTQWSQSPSKPGSWGVVERQSGHPGPTDPERALSDGPINSFPYFSYFLSSLSPNKNERRSLFLAVFRSWYSAYSDVWANRIESACRSSSNGVSQSSSFRRAIAAFSTLRLERFKIWWILATCRMSRDKSLLASWGPWSMMIHGSKILNFDICSGSVAARANHSKACPGMWVPVG